MELPTGIRLTRELDKERIALENLLNLRDRAAAAGLPVRHLTYEELNDDHSKLDDRPRDIMGIYRHIVSSFHNKAAPGEAQAPVWKSTSALGYRVDGVDSPRHRADAVTGTTSRRWRRTSTPRRAPEI